MCSIQSKKNRLRLTAEKKTDFMRNLKLKWHYFKHSTKSIHFYYYYRCHDTSWTDTSWTTKTLLFTVFFLDRHFLDHQFLNRQFLLLSVLAALCQFQWSMNWRSRKCHVEPVHFKCALVHSSDGKSKSCIMWRGPWRFSCGDSTKLPPPQQQKAIWQICKSLNTVMKNEYLRRLDS